LRLHLAVARKRMFRIVGELLHPIAQLRHMHAEVLRSLHIGHASLLDQAHSLKLELAGKLPSLHDPPPAPSKHLTRCLRNRVQARLIFFWSRRRSVAPVAHMKTQSRKSLDSWPKPDTISWILLTSTAVPNTACSGSANSPFSAKEARSWMPHPTSDAAVK